MLESSLMASNGRVHLIGCPLSALAAFHLIQLISNSSCRKQLQISSLSSSQLLFCFVFVFVFFSFYFYFCFGYILAFLLCGV